MSVSRKRIEQTPEDWCRNLPGQDRPIQPPWKTAILDRHWHNRKCSPQTPTFIFFWMLFFGGSRNFWGWSIAGGCRSLGVGVGLCYPWPILSLLYFLAAKRLCPPWPHITTTMIFFQTAQGPGARDWSCWNAEQELIFSLFRTFCQAFWSPLHEVMNTLTQLKCPKYTPLCNSLIDAYRPNSRSCPLRENCKTIHSRSIPPTVYNLNIHP